MQQGVGLELVRTDRAVRSASFAYAILPIGLYLWGRDAGIWSWTLLLFQFLVYPQLVYWRAIRSARPARAELDNLFLDAAFLGAWVAFLGFPIWITYALISAAALNAAVNRGWQGLALAIVSSAVGAALWAAVGGFTLTLETSHPVTFLAAAGSLAYVSAVGIVVWRQNRRLAAARDELRRSEERYRLIAENADDLVAMLDHEGRWLYTSPSYARVLAPAELAPGGDAFKHIHPDDADHAHMVIGRAAATGKPRELALRMVDREGRIRQFRSHVRAVMSTPAPYKVVLVSRDVTDLKESEERMLLAAHALEGMTEGIMITSADGTIVTVNRAFSEITGHTRDEVLGQSEKSIRSGLLPPEFYDEAYAAVHRDGYWSGTSWAKRKNGSVYREWRSVRAVKDEKSGAITHYVHVFYEAGSPRTSAGQAVS
ncbi:MAG TPA: PAS domain S-box protein [Burkholderiales bacterium]|nr:PAS domain S-box protein [Burkholderiales bacterium]